MGCLVCYHALLAEVGLALWHRVPLLVLLVMFRGSGLAWVSYSEFRCVVSLDGPSPFPDWLQDICALCVHLGGGHL